MEISSDGSKNRCSFEVNNSRNITVQLGIEPWGCYWPMEPNAVFEIVFADAKDLLSVEYVHYADDGITFWFAYPTAVYLLHPDGTKQDMMNA